MRHILEDFLNEYLEEQVRLGHKVESGLLRFFKNLPEELNKVLQSKLRELKGSEDLYQKLLDGVENYAIARLSKSGTVLSWNKGAERVNGYNEKVIGKNFRIFYTKEDRKNKVPERLLEDAVKTGKATYEGWMLRNDGTNFWAYTVFSILHDEENRIAGFSKITRDLTERKFAEDMLNNLNKALADKNSALRAANHELMLTQRKLADERTHSLVQAMPHSVATASYDGRPGFFNQHLLDYTGLAAEELNGWGWTHVIHEDDRERLFKEWKMSGSVAENFQSEFRLKRADGEYFWHLVLIKPLLHSDDSLNMWIVTLTDIHDQKIMEEKKDEFIALASHELKTPLTSAMAYAELLTQNLSEKNIEEAWYAKKTGDAIGRLSELVSELLDLSKIRHSTLQFQMEELSIDDVLSDAIEQIQQLSPGHKIMKKGSFRRMIKGDKNRIMQVCLNLISNAIKYSPKSDKVEVTVEGSDRGVTIGVRDYGIGIRKGELTKIFNRFYRVHEKTEQFQGLGIGLYISAEIVKHHQGMIWVESEYGKGSSFYFALPVLSGKASEKYSGVKNRNREGEQYFKKKRKNKQERGEVYSND